MSGILKLVFLFFVVGSFLGGVLIYVVLGYLPIWNVVWLLASIVLLVEVMNG